MFSTIHDFGVWHLPHSNPTVCSWVSEWHAIHSFWVWENISVLWQSLQSTILCCPTRGNSVVSWLNENELLSIFHPSVVWQSPQLVLKSFPCGDCADRFRHNPNSNIIDDRFRIWIHLICIAQKSRPSPGLVCGTFHRQHSYAVRREQTWPCYDQI